MKINKKWLLVIAAALWGFPGIMLFAKGVRIGSTMPEKWWLYLIAVAVLAQFLFMFTRIVDRYSAFTLSGDEEKKTIIYMFPPKGWIILVVMPCLGILFKHLPFIPAEFYPAFYPGLGLALVYAAWRFIRNSMK